MKVILDECLPKRLIYELPGHEVVTVPMAGWAGVKNGELLRKMDGHYDAFLTVDALVAQSETVKGFRFRIIILKARSNKIEDLRPLVPKILATLSEAKPGNITSIS